MPQALWLNLVARMQHLLNACLLATADTVTMCQELADTLAAQAAAAPVTASSFAAGSGGRTAVQLLQCSEGLIAHSLQLLQQAAEAAEWGMDGEEVEHAAAWVQQLQDALVEVSVWGCEMPLVPARVGC